MLLNGKKQLFTVLGSGSVVPQLNRASAANLLRADADTVLIDAGRGFLNRLFEAGLGPDIIDYVCLTHFHPDHCGELASFIAGRYYNSQLAWVKPLKIIAGTGLNAWWDKLCQVWPGLRKPFAKGLVVLQELATGQTTFLGPWRVSALPTGHKPESLAYRFEYDGKSVVVSGDTGPVAALADFARKADLLVLECAAGLATLPKHLSVLQAAEIAAAAQPKKLLLTHFYPEHDIKAIEQAFTAVYKGTFETAYDLLTVEV